MPIKVKNLNKVYPGGLAAVKDNSFIVNNGEVFGLLGPNGAGKSTTFNILSLGMKRTNGKINLFNENIDVFSSI